MSKDQIELENQIITQVNRNNPSRSSVHFEYGSDNDAVNVTVTTFNPIHNTKFVLEMATATDRAEALRMILDKILAKAENEYTYSVEWSKKDDGKNQISHFTAGDYEEVLEKFWHAKKRGDYDIWLIRKNPVS